MVTKSSVLQRRVVIVDDSRTIQAMLDNAFSKRSDFRVVGFANNATSAVDMIRRLVPDIVTIDLCMPYIDGAALLEMISDMHNVCKIVVSDKSLTNLLLTARLQDAGASVCLSKRSIIDDAEGFFKKVNDAAQMVSNKKRIHPASIGLLPSACETRSDGARLRPLLTFPVPADERERIAFVNKRGLADAKRERSFDLITKHVAKITAFPVCLLTVIDRDTQWIKSAYGMELDCTPRDQAFCSYTIAQGGTFVVSNAAVDDRFKNYPLVKSLPNIRSYAGHPVVSREGVAVAALCIIDTRVRTVSQHVIDQLISMSEVISEMIDQRALSTAA
jgi:GAF domain-containing protein